MSLNIFYLDDEELLCENFVDNFATNEVIISTFTDAIRAIEAIKKNPPDLFFVDYRLPGFTGDDVAKAIDPNIPKFLITGEIFVKTEYKFIEVIPKPYDENYIADLISKYVALKSLG